MINFLTFNKIRKVFSLLLLIFFVLPLSRCERASYSEGPKHGSESAAAQSQESRQQESTPSMTMDFYVYIYIREGLNKLDFSSWKDALTFVGTALSFMAMIFLPLGLWRAKDLLAAIIFLAASPAIAYGIFISVWLWPIQLLPGYLLTLIWCLLFSASLFQLYLLWRNRKIIQTNS